MGIANAVARVTKRDVADLMHASELLATVAAQIKRVNALWAPGVVQLLIDANTPICRIADKGARAFARYYESHGIVPPGPEPEAAAGDDGENPEPQSDGR